MLAPSDHNQNNVQVSLIYLSAYAKAHVRKDYNETPGCALFTRFVQTNSSASFSIGEDRAAIVKAVVLEASTAECFDLVQCI